jgi:hypothetical protein
VQTPNEPAGMMIRYYLARPGGAATIAIADSAGHEVARLDGPGAAGVNTVMWNTRRPGAGRGGGRGAAGTVLDQLMPLGKYTVTLKVGEIVQSQNAEIVATQGWPIGASSSVIRKR